MTVNDMNKTSILSAPVMALASVAVATFSACTPSAAPAPASPTGADPAQDSVAPVASVASGDAEEHHYFHREEKGHKADWGYGEADGPAMWASLDPSYALAREGRSQSPIDLSSAAAEGGVPFAVDYAMSKINLVYNGHTVEEMEDKGSFLTVGNQRYELAQFHFHAPSEHTVDGKHAAMEMHLVHKNEAGDVAVLGVLIEEGDVDNPAFADVWRYLPSDEMRATTSEMKIQPTAMLPADRSAYEYVGSFTTPPCTEGVKWIVLRTPALLSSNQIDAFRAIISGNNRPTQPLHGREVVLTR